MRMWINRDLIQVIEDEDEDEDPVCMHARENAWFPVWKRLNNNAIIINIPLKK